MNEKLQTAPAVPLPKLLEQGIKNAWQMAIFATVIVAVFAIHLWFDDFNGLINIYNLSFAVVVNLALAYGIYRKSRLCAVLILAFYVVSKMTMTEINLQDSRNLLIAVITFRTITLWLYANGVAGTVLYHRHQKTGQFSNKQ